MGRVRKIEIIKTVRAVERNQPCHLLEVLRFELHAGRCLDMKGGLPTRKQALREIGCDALPAIQPEMTLASRKAGDLIEGDARCLPLDSERVCIEIVSRGRLGPGMQR